MKKQKKNYQVQSLHEVDNQCLVPPADVQVLSYPPMFREEEKTILETGYINVN